MKKTRNDRVCLYHCKSKASEVDTMLAGRDTDSGEQLRLGRDHVCVSVCVDKCHALKIMYTGIVNRGRTCGSKNHTPYTSMCHPV